MTDPHDDFMDFFVASQAYVYGYVRATVINGADAEELFQQIALTLWKKRDTFDPSLGSFRAWAMGIARNHIRNFVRHHAVDKRTQVFSTDVVERISECHGQIDDDWDERQKALATCLAKLRVAERSWLEDYYGGVRKPRQIAQTEGISLRTFYRKLQKLRSILLDCIVRTMGSEADSYAGS